MQAKKSRLIHSLNPDAFQRVVFFDPRHDKIAPLDLTAGNTALTEDIFHDVARFSDWIDYIRENQKAKYLVGGYNELRKMYSRSELFGNNLSAAHEEPRRLHIGTDIWGPEGTKVFSPLTGRVHSFAFNDQYGDYGSTIVLEHRVKGGVFHTLYGHLSKADLEDITEGREVRAGSAIGHFGNFRENGGWPPHLHFQVIRDMEGMKGDYPGVCRYSERLKYLGNCPDPDFILQMNQFLER